MNLHQHTMAGPVTFTGVGLHTGELTRATILPAPPDSGIAFRIAGTGTVIPAAVDHVIETAYSTVLSRGGARIATVEHVLAGLYGMGVDNALVEVDGPELPILDGSALPIAAAIRARGLVEQHARRRFLRVSERERIRCNGSFIVAGPSPSDDLVVLMMIDFPGTVIGRQWLRFTLNPDTFLEEIAPARTFVLREQIDGLWSTGMAQGGSLDNAIVVEGYAIQNPEGLRFRDEFVRHKILDFLGDMALLGRPVAGSFLAVRSGHTVNRCLTEYLSGFSDPRPAAMGEKAAEEAGFIVAG
jgi:UDP-3-O-[3-hydroxymyristoyl] N-acetylglucosamine deacetylase